MGDLTLARRQRLGFGAEKPQEQEYYRDHRGGPAGLTAGLYAAERARSLLLGPVGQAATTSEMDNYPGFPEGIGMAPADRCRTTPLALAPRSCTKRS